MPYSGPGDSSLPSNVKKLPDKQKRQWVSIFNSTYNSCIKDGGGEQECESKAFRIANGVLKKVKMKMIGKIKKIFGQKPVEPPDVLELNRSVLRQTKDGRYRLISVSGAAVLNRMGEIDSRALFDGFVALHRSTGHNPKRDFMHMGPAGEQWVVGEVDFMERIGNLFVTSTLYNDSDLAKMEIQSRQNNPEFWGDSIAYVVLDNPVVENIGDEEKPVFVFRLGHLNFVSTVPEAIAASEFTKGEVKEVYRMWTDLDDILRNSLVSLFGGNEESAQTWFTNNVEKKNEEIDREGLVNRSVEETVEEVETEAEPEVEVETDDDELEVELELNDEMVDDIVARVAAHESFTAQFNQILERLEAIDAAMASVTDKARQENDEVQRRLEKLEKEEEEKIAEIAADMPRKATLRVSHRPSEAYKDSGGPEYAEQAESVLASWGDYPTK